MSRNSVLEEFSVSQSGGRKGKVECHRDALGNKRKGKGVRTVWYSNMRYSAVYIQCRPYNMVSPMLW